MRETEQAAVRIPPPLLYLGVLAAGLSLSAMLPTPVLASALSLALGALLVVSGLAVGATAFAAMRRAGESPNHAVPTRSLVVSGPYQFTRNPFYVAMTLVYSGIAIAFNSLWALALLVVVLIVMDRSVIASEESYLRSLFGDSYAQYQARVRRWI
jgi:protein-S-isoprenylcysteine O-methyltransferase Ste14